MQFNYFFIRYTGELVQAVNILGDDTENFSLLYQFAHCQMAFIGLSLFHDRVGGKFAAPRLPAHFVRSHEIVKIDRLVFSPNSVLMPAPVKTTPTLLSLINNRNCLISASFSDIIFS